MPLCGVYTFDSEDRLAGEKSITTGGTVLPQLGRFPRPAKCVGPAVHFSDASGDDCEGAYKKTARLLTFRGVGFSTMRA